MTHPWCGKCEDCRARVNGALKEAFAEPRPTAKRWKRGAKTKEKWWESK